MIAANGDAQRDACARVGVANKDVPADGAWHGADVDGDHRGRGDARIKRFADGRGGIVWNWKTNESATFFDDDEGVLSVEERKQRARVSADARREAEQEIQRRRIAAADTAAAIWRQAHQVKADHPYLARKQCQPSPTLKEITASELAQLIGYAPKSSGQCLIGRVLIVPVNIGSGISTVEMIDEGGRKSALSGGAKAGGYWPAQPLPEGDGRNLRILIAEGVSTALSAQAATELPVVAALSCGNLEPVARAMRERYPAAELVLLADLGNGQGDAERAAGAVSGYLALPKFDGATEQGGTDFNDLAVALGLEAVRKCIEEAQCRTTPAGNSIQWPEQQELLAQFESAPYPLDALPPLIRSAVEEVQAFTKAPVALVAVSALSAVSLAVQAYIDVERASGLSGPVSLFSLVIADSGERKTTCDKQFIETIREYDRAQYEKAKPLIALYCSDFRAWEATKSGILDAIKRAAKKPNASGDLEDRLQAHEGKIPIEPRVPRLIYGDATPEALAHGLFNKWPSGGVISSEGGAILGSHGMGAESQMRNLSIMNQLWDGTAQTFDRRKEGGSFRLEGARFTMALQVQEPTLRNFFDRSGELCRGTGWLARFLIAWPESTQGTRIFSDPPASWPALSAFRRRIEEILTEPVRLNEVGGLSPTLLSLTKEAKGDWIAYHDSIERMLGSGGELQDVRDVASKSADNAARLAALFHVFAHGSGGAIRGDSLAGACRLAAWHLNESRRFFGELHLPPETANATRLDSWLIAHCRRNGTDRIARRDLQRHVTPVRLRDKAPLSKALAVLAEAGRVREVTDGKRKDVCLNPALLPGSTA